MTCVSGVHFIASFKPSIMVAFEVNSFEMLILSVSSRQLQADSFATNRDGISTQVLWGAWPQSLVSKDSYIQIGVSLWGAWHVSLVSKGIPIDVLSGSLPPLLCSWRERRREIKKKLHLFALQRFTTSGEFRKKCRLTDSGRRASCFEYLFYFSMGQAKKTSFTTPLARSEDFQRTYKITFSQILGNMLFISSSRFTSFKRKEARRKVAYGHLARCPAADTLG